MTFNLLNHQTIDLLTVFFENMSGFDVNANIATSFSSAGCRIMTSESEAYEIVDEFNVNHFIGFPTKLFINE